MFLPILMLIGGLAILLGGGEYFVRGSASIAKKLGLPAIVIGLTVVAFGTSAPELIVNIFSSAKGATDLAIANIAGSNLANILLILGIGATIKKLAVKEATTFKEIPFALLAIAMVAVMGNDAFFDHVYLNQISRIDGMILLSFFVIFLYYVFGIGKMQAEHEGVKSYSWQVSLSMFVLGLAGLVLGAKFMVDGAVRLAILAGLSEALIGLTIVAVGTSLPELVVTALAVRRGHTDLAIGNIVGSNIFNVFFVLGISSIIRPLPFDTFINTDIIATAVATLLLFIFVYTFEKHTIKRWQGVLFIALYVAYIGYAVIR